MFGTRAASLSAAALLLTGPSSAAALAQRAASALQVDTAGVMRVQAGKVVRPDTVEVGDPFVLTVTVEAPTGSRIEWPAIADSNAAVVMTEPVKVTDAGAGPGGRREQAEYVLSAWQLGSLPLGLPNAIVRVGDAVAQVPLADASVFVRSVLPADTSLQVPRPARDPFLRVTPWWQRWLIAALILMTLGLLWWVSRRFRQRSAAIPAVQTNPYLQALDEFERIGCLGLVDAGEAGLHAALSIDVLRAYIEARNPDAAMSCTSDELTAVLQSDQRFPQDRLRSLLSDGDQIKFAGRQIASLRALELGVEARAIVDLVEQREREHQAAAREAEAAQQRASELERREREEQARRSSLRKSGGGGKGARR